ncbi:MAG: tetratricopeptide repeat protein [Haliscomenobacter sp.]|uniref:tetratricopeptide repeat protein n=1 Tax=Haliscomenobacter sp. TaxID=2717303 RepID=UPI00299FAB6C|nr:tetratricopeptide repeat protein [Haliscomenobacter sp.]MDX2072100.1 tetratricopeptide repeat protein [Haliscomenobacter sp.]
MSKAPKGRKTTGGKPVPNKTASDKPSNPSHIPALEDSGTPPTRLHLIILAVLSILLYANTLGHQFTQDDAIVITENMHVQKGWAGLSDIFNKDTFHGFFKTDKQGLVEGGRYRPFTLAMFAVELSIFGKSPFWGHLFNVLWYGLTGLVFYLLASGLFAYRWNKTLSSWLAFAAAVLFVAHPLHTEAVANIKGRDEIMALLGSLAALYFSLRSFKSGNLGWEALAAVSFLIGIFSKENTITFLAVVPLTYWFFTNASIGQMLRQSAPFFVVAILFLIVRSNVLTNAQIGAASNELMNNPYLKIEGNQYVPFSGAERQATVFYTLGKYIQLFLFPYPLTHDYYPNHIPRMNWGQPGALLSFLLYLGMGIVGVMGLRKKSPVAYGLLFYLTTLSIVSNVWLVVGTNMSERFVFMPSVGLCIAVVSGLATLFYGEKLKQTARPQALLLSIGAVVVIFGALTFLRNFAWKDNLTLFSTDAKTSINSAKVHNSLGGVLMDEARKIENDSIKKMALLQEASTNLLKAVEIHPNYRDAYTLLGNCYFEMKNYAESVKYFNAAYSINNTDTLVKKNLGVAYRLLGQEEGEKRGNLTQALQYLQQSLALNPNDYATQRLLGVANSFGGNDQAALPYFEKARDLVPQSADAWFELHMAYQKVGDLTRAQQALARAQQIDPEIAQKFAQKGANPANK